MSDYIEKIDTVDIDKIKSEFNSYLEREIKGTLQVSLQGFSKDDFTGANGKTDNLKNNEEDCNVRLYDDYKYTYDVIEKFNLYRSRLMIISDKRNYSWHLDYSKRIHIPLITNESCFFIIEETKIHLPADGSVYLVDTTKWHTFVNANRNKFDRSHIVGCV